jgi:subtilisin family serine protease
MGLRFDPGKYVRPVLGALVLALGIVATPARVNAARPETFSTPAEPKSIGLRTDAVIVRLRSAPPSITGVRARPPVAVEREASRLGAWLEPEFPNDEPPFSRFWIAHLPPDATLGQARGHFATLAEVEDVAPIARVSALAIPNDSLWRFATQFFQSSRRDIHAPEAWDVTVGDTSVLVAIVDTGVLTDHPDLVEQFYFNRVELEGAPGVDDDANGFIDDFRGWDFVNLPPTSPVRLGEDGQDEDNEPSDFAGHGTAVAGLVGARTNNRIGVAGTAWRVRLLPLRVGWSSPTYPSGEGDVSYMARAIRYATRMGAQVINCSFLTAKQPDLEAAVDAAVAAGVTIVTAAGNFGVSHYLAQRGDVISVTATDQEDRATAWATTGPNVDLAAPGNRLPSTSVDRDDLGHRFPDYTTGATGTSFSAPLVAGAVALLDARRLALHLPPLTPFEIRMRLMDTADDVADRNVGAAGIGSGRLNLLRLLTDPPMSRVAIASASLSGPVAVLPGQSNGPNLVVLAARNGKVLVIDGASGAIESQADLGAAPAGGVAVAALDNESRVGVFVATLDGRIHGFDRALSPLPGWPVPAPVSASSLTHEPALGDLDGDGELEVVWCGGLDGTVRVWHADGRPFTPGFPLAVASGDLTVALSDLDGNPGAEIVLGGSRVRVLRADGSPLPGWPSTAPSTYPPLVVGFGRGRRPAVIAAESGRIQALDRDGALLWSRGMAIGQAPVAMDLNGDGSDELLVVRSSPLVIAAVDSSGADARGWTPSEIPTGTFLGPPVVGALGGPGSSDVLIPHGTRGLLAFHANGLPIRSFPRAGGGVIAATIADLDGDGATDVFAGSNSDAALYFYEIERGTWHEPTSPWLTARGNAARTGSTLYTPEIGRAASSPPSVVTDLAVRSVSQGRVELDWSAPTGAAGEPVVRYDVRFTTQPIDASNLYAARAAGGLPLPGPPGTRQSVVVTGLDESATYYFVVRSQGAGHAWSAPSNVASAATPIYPPDRVADLRWTARTDTTFTLNWTATGNDGRVGRPARYRIRAADAPIDDANFEQAPHGWEVAPTVAAGAVETATLNGLPLEQRFQVALRAVDANGNESRVSNSIEISTATVGPAAVVDLRVRGWSDIRVALEWTASGDDGRTGRASAYEVRAAAGPFDDASIGQSRVVATLPATADAGRVEAATVAGFDPGTQQTIAIVTIDGVGNRSPLSNRVTVDFPATAAPGVTDLAIASHTEDAVTIGWRAPDSWSPAGYLIRAATEPITENTFDAAPFRWVVSPHRPPTVHEQATVGGLLQDRHYWVAVAAFDGLSIRSGLSNVVEVTLTAIAPARVSDLRQIFRTDTSQTLFWSATGDDDHSGQPAIYRLRAAEVPLPDSSFDEAPYQWEAPARTPSGGTESMTVTGLPTGRTFWGALVAIDDQGNTSDISNWTQISTATVAPAPVTDLRIRTRDQTQAVIEWTSTGDDFWSGQPRGYEVRVAEEPFDEASIDRSRVLAEVPSAHPAFWTEQATIGDFEPGSVHYVALVTIDPIGTRSPLSNVVSFVTLDGPVPRVTDLALEFLSENVIRLTWHNPGDVVHRVPFYSVALTTDSLTDSTFDAAKRLTIAARSGPGGDEEATLGDLQSGRRYQVGVAVLDTALRRSRVSNVIDFTVNPIPPGRIADLAIAGFANTRVDLQWTATGDDEWSGRPSLYRIRASREPMDSAVFARTTLEWDAIPLVEPGYRQTASIAGLEYDTHYWLGVVAVDHAGNESRLSNVVDILLADTPPARVTSLAVQQRSDQRVTLAWIAPGGDGVIGRAKSYALHATRTPMDSAAFESASLGWEVPARYEAGGAEAFRVPDLEPSATYWFALRGTDSTGHASPISNVLMVTTTVVPPSPVSLSLNAISDTVLTIRWTASGDDGFLGWARLNRLRASEDRIADSTFDRAPYSWDLAPTVAGRGVETAFIRGFPKNQRLWFAMVVEDSAGNRSRVSSNLSITTRQQPPAPVTGLRVASVVRHGARIEWLATGEDGTVGFASRYLVRASALPLDSAAFEAAPLRWEFAGSGTFQESATITDPAFEGSFHAAVVAEDRAGNRSPLSSNVEIAIAIPPSAVRDLKVLERSDSNATLTWTATGDDDSTGRPRLYRIRAATAPMDSAAFEQASLRWEIAATVDAGNLERTVLPLDSPAPYWFAIQAEDLVGNRSPVSNQVDTTTPTRARWIVDRLEASSIGEKQVRLIWHVVGDGDPPRRYRIAAAESPLDDAGFDAAPLQWEVAAGTARDHTEAAELSLPAERRYWIAVAVTSDEGWRSPMSQAIELWVGRAAEPPGLHLITERQPAHAPVRLSWQTREAGEGRRLSIYDARGRLQFATALAGGHEGSLTWDGRDRRGHPVRPGLYFARLSESQGSVAIRIVLIE